MRPEDPRMKRSSHSRVRRSVTPLRSGPTLIPFPKVWQPVQRLRKIVFASSAAFAGDARPPAAARTRVIINRREAMRVGHEDGARDRNSFLAGKQVVLQCIFVLYRLRSIADFSDVTSFPLSGEQPITTSSVAERNRWESTVTCSVSHNSEGLFKTYFSTYR